MHFLSFTDISMVIYHYGAIAARGSEGVKILNSEYEDFKILVKSDYALKRCVTVT